MGRVELACRAEMGRRAVIEVEVKSGMGVESSALKSVYYIYICVCMCCGAEGLEQCLSNGTLLAETAPAVDMQDFNICY